VTCRSCCLLVVLVAFPSLADAQTVSAPQEPGISFSGYLQPQFELRSADETTTDRAFFRRLVLTLEAVLSPDWRAEFQLDVGPVASGDDRPIVKDAHLQYTGWEHRGVLVTVGNQKMPFSRSLLASSSRRGLIERPFAGDRSFGSPGRALAVQVSGWHRRSTVHWAAALASSRQSPDPDEVRLDGTAEAEDGWNEGPLAGGRIELHPLGEVPSDQGDVERGPVRFTVGAGAYGWWNDDDVERHRAGVDADRAAALEVSGGFRGRGLSMDVEIEHVVSRALDLLAARGLYDTGTATLTKGSIEAGYLVVGRLEALGSIDRLDASGFGRPWHRVAGGMNWYANGRAVKFSVMHRESYHERGERNGRSRSTYLQAHIAF